MKTPALLAALTACALALPLPATAHEGGGPHDHAADRPHDHATDHAPQHGGIVVEQHHSDIELVARPDAIALYVRVLGRPATSAGGTAKLTLLAGGKKTEVALAPAGANKFEARGAYPIGPGTKALATVALAGQPAMALRFELR